MIDSIGKRDIVQSLRDEFPLSDEAKSSPADVPNDTGIWIFLCMW